MVYPRPERRCRASTVHQARVEKQKGAAVQRLHVAKVALGGPSWRFLWEFDGYPMEISRRFLNSMGFRAMEE